MKQIWLCKRDMAVLPQKEALMASPFASLAFAQGILDRSKTVTGFYHPLHLIYAQEEPASTTQTLELQYKVDLTLQAPQQKNAHQPEKTAEKAVESRTERLVERIVREKVRMERSIIRQTVPTIQQHCHTTVQAALARRAAFLQGPMAQAKALEEAAMRRQKPHAPAELRYAQVLQRNQAAGLTASPKAPIERQAFPPARSSIAVQNEQREQESQDGSWIFRKEAELRPLQAPVEAALTLHPEAKDDASGNIQQTSRQREAEMQAKRMQQEHMREGASDKQNENVRAAAKQAEHMQKEASRQAEEMQKEASRQAEKIQKEAAGEAKRIRTEAAQQAAHIKTEAERPQEAKKTHAAQQLEEGRKLAAQQRIEEERPETPKQAEDTRRGEQASDIHKQGVQLPSRQENRPDQAEGIHETVTSVKPADAADSAQETETAFAGGLAEVPSQMQTPSPQAELTYNQSLPENDAAMQTMPAEKTNRGGTEAHVSQNRQASQQTEKQQGLASALSHQDVAIKREPDAQASDSNAKKTVVAVNKAEGSKQAPNSAVTANAAQAEAAQAPDVRLEEEAETAVQAGKEQEAIGQKSAGQETPSVPMAAGRAEGQAGHSALEIPAEMIHQQTESLSSPALEAGMRAAETVVEILEAKSKQEKRAVAPSAQEQRTTAPEQVIPAARLNQDAAPETGSIDGSSKNASGVRQQAAATPPMAVGPAQGQAERSSLEIPAEMVHQQAGVEEQSILAAGPVLEPNMAPAQNATLFYGPEQGQTTQPVYDPAVAGATRAQEAGKKQGVVPAAQLARPDTSPKAARVQQGHPNGSPAGQSEELAQPGDVPAIAQAPSRPVAEQFARAPQVQTLQYAAPPQQGLEGVMTPWHRELQTGTNAAFYQHPAMGGSPLQTGGTITPVSRPLNSVQTPESMMGFQRATVGESPQLYRNRAMMAQSQPLTYAAPAQQNTDNRGRASAVKPKPQASTSQATYEESPYVQSLPGWARDFLRDSFHNADGGAKASMGASGTVDRNSQKPTGTAAPVHVGKPEMAEQMVWSAPGYAGPAAKMTHKKKEQPQEQPPLRFSDTEIKRMANQVYGIIQDRLKRDQRRLGL